VKCLVTGATGFIGKPLCLQLVQRGYAVTALSRSGDALPDGAPTVALDLAQGPPGADLLAGVDVVYHLAGIAHRRAPAADYEVLNYRATLELARQAELSGVGRFVYLSSVKAMGPGGGDAPRSEEDTSEPTDPYGRSKWLAEQGLRAEFTTGAMSVVILRPALVCGPGARGNLALLARAARSGLPRPPGRGGRSLVALDDLVELLCRAATLRTKGVKTWIACDPQPWSTRDIYDRMRRAAGRGTGRAWLPPFAWRLGAALLDLARGGGGDESTWDRLFGSELYSNARVVAATGWRPRQPLAEVIDSLAGAGEGGQA